MFAGARRLLVLVPVLVCSPLGQTKEFTNQVSRLKLFHTHTGERIDVVYRRGGGYVPEALAALDNFLRDPARAISTISTRGCSIYCRT
jgi:uncharacterized protein YcbK (DUF882 family)